jgi:hypothetical protein
MRIHTDPDPKHSEKHLTHTVTGVIPERTCIHKSNAKEKGNTTEMLPLSPRTCEQSYVL